MKTKFTRLAALVILACLLASCGTDTGSKQEERPQITWYLRTDYIDLYNQLEGIKRIEDATGVDVVFQAPQNNSEDAYRIMIASGNLPDVIMWSHTTGTDRLYTDGIAIDVTELTEKYAPNLTHIYNTRPSIRREVESSDGRLYYFPSINPMLTEEEIGRKSYSGLIIRQDWLDKLGLEVPRTIDEWYQVLYAFRTRDPNGNGVQDEVPFEGWGLSYFMPAFGILRGMCVKPDGSVVYGPSQPEYLEFLETMHKWYSEGLLGKNYYLYSEKWKEENIVNNICGAFVGLDNAWRYYLPSLLEKEPAAQLTAVSWPEDRAGVRYTAVTAMAGHVADIKTFITPACKNPEAAVRFIDYMYSEAGNALTHWGVEGVTYNVDEQGRKQLTDYALSVGKDGFISLYYYAIGHTSFPKYDGETVVLASYPEDQLIAERTWADMSTGLIYPATISMSAEDQALCDGILSEAAAYMEEMELGFITGSEPLSGFDLYTAQLEKLGINRVVEIYNRYYTAEKEKENKQ